jgi:hypothetical protein
MDARTTVALLAPVPEEHLISGLEACAEHGRVSFGSRDFLVFQKLDEILQKEPCEVLIYASWPIIPLNGPPKVTWRAKYRSSIDARSDGSPPKGVIRPSSTEKYPGDNKGHWGIYWEVFEIERLSKEDRIPVSLLKGIGSATTYKTTFIPERPLIIEAL